MTSPYGSADDMARLMYGQNARHVPAWMYVQDQGPGVVGLVGASRVPDGQEHPLVYGGGHYRQRGGEHYWAHHFIVGEVIVRPHLVVATNALKGDGAGSLYLGEHDFDRMLGDGELIIGSDAALRRVRKQWEG
ncbi:MAG TPA: hypothetical protein VFB06_11615 [Streptosporangiaceae bacterium]|nr:hypothetical protein [Streptosporangiaceae bacterium]